MSGPVTIRIQEDDFDIAREIAGLIQGRTDIGAVVTFSGICRTDEDSAKISALKSSGSTSKRHERPRKNEGRH